MGFRSFRVPLVKWARSFQRCPRLGKLAESQIRFSLLVASDVSAVDLAERLDFPDTEVSLVLAASNEKLDVSLRMKTRSAPTDVEFLDRC